MQSGYNFTIGAQLAYYKCGRRGEQQRLYKNAQGPAAGNTKLPGKHLTHHDLSALLLLLLLLLLLAAHSSSCCSIAGRANTEKKTCKEL